MAVGGLAVLAGLTYWLAVRGRTFGLAVAIVGINVGGLGTLAGLTYCLVVRQPFGAVDARVVHGLGMAFKVPGGRSDVWWSQGPSIEQLASYVRGRDVLKSGDREMPVRVATVSADFFRVFALQPALGRDFEPADEDAPSVGAAIVSRRLVAFLKRAGTPMGQEIRVGVRRYLIVGIAPEGLSYPAGTEVWVAGLVGGASAHGVRLAASEALPIAPWGGWVLRIAANAQIESARDELLGRLKDLNLRFASSGRRYGDTISLMRLDEVSAQTVIPKLRAWSKVAGVLFVIAAGNAIVVGRRARLGTKSPLRSLSLHLISAVAGVSLSTSAVALMILSSEAGRRLTFFPPDRYLVGATLLMTAMMAGVTTVTILVALLWPARERGRNNEWRTTHTSRQRVGSDRYSA
jgi:hypothetical protein